MPHGIAGRIREGMRMAEIQDREVISINISKLDEDILFDELYPTKPISYLRYRIRSVFGVDTRRAKVLSITLKL
jgi:hypothetical protein